MSLLMVIIEFTACATENRGPVNVKLAENREVVFGAWCLLRARVCERIARRALNAPVTIPDSFYEPSDMSEGWACQVIY